MRLDAKEKGIESPPLALAPHAWTPPFFFIGALLCIAGFGIYFAGILFSVVRLLLALKEPFRAWNEAIIWYSGLPVTFGLALVALDLVLMFPAKRRQSRLRTLEPIGGRKVVVALTAYNDDLSIAQAVADFQAHPLVERVIVVDNNSKDKTSECARAAGAQVVLETSPVTVAACTAAFRKHSRKARSS